MRTSCVFVGMSPLRTSPAGPGGAPSPFLLAGRPGPVVLKSGRNRRYRPVARPVIDSRAVTNQVSGPRPSGHFPAPTSGPRRSTVSPRPPGGSRSGPRGPVKLSLSRLPLDAGPPPLYVEETRLSREASPSRGPQPTAFHAAMSVHSWTSSTRLVATGPCGGTSRSSPPPPLSSRAEARREKLEKRNEKAKIAGGWRRGGEEELQVEKEEEEMKTKKKKKKQKK